MQAVRNGGGAGCGTFPPDSQLTLWHGHGRAAREIASRRPPLLLRTIHDPGSRHSEPGTGACDTTGTQVGTVTELANLKRHRFDAAPARGANTLEEDRPTKASTTVSGNQGSPARPTHSVRRSSETAVRPGHSRGIWSVETDESGPLAEPSNRRNLLQRNRFLPEPPRGFEPRTYALRAVRRPPKATLLLVHTLAYPGMFGHACALLRGISGAFGSVQPVSLCQRPVSVASMFDAQDNDFPGVLADPVQDPVGAASC